MLDLVIAGDHIGAVSEMALQAMNMEIIITGM